MDKDQEPVWPPEPVIEPTAYYDVFEGTRGDDGTFRITTEIRPDGHVFFKEVD